MLSLPYPVYVEYIDQITREPRHKTVFELFVPSPQHDLNGKRVHALLQITNFGTVHSLISVNLVFFSEFFAYQRGILLQEVLQLLKDMLKCGVGETRLLQHRLITYKLFRSLS